MGRETRALITSVVDGRGTLHSEGWWKGGEEKSARNFFNSLNWRFFFFFCFLKHPDGNNKTTSFHSYAAALPLFYGWIRLRAQSDTCFPRTNELLIRSGLNFELLDDAFYCFSFNFARGIIAFSEMRNWIKEDGVSLAHLFSNYKFLYIRRAFLSRAHR